MNIYKDINDFWPLDHRLFLEYEVNIIWTEKSFKVIA